MASFSNVSTYLLVWFVIYVTDKTIVATIPTGIVDWVEESCANNSYCTTEGTHYNGSMLPKVCCEPCTCNAECSNLGNCCSDNLGKKIDITFKKSCRPGFYKKSGYDLQRLTYWELDMLNAVNYWMVTTCLDGSKCDLDSLDDDNATVNDVSPYYSAEYNTIFQDRRCAECNDITNTSRWELNAVQCFDLKLDQLHISDKELLQYIKEQCVFVALPPDSDIFQRIRCVPEYEIQRRSRCNESGLWDTYNETTKKFCEDPNGWYPVRYNDVIYKNVYCFICNTIHFNKIKYIEAEADLTQHVCKILGGRDGIFLSNVLESFGQIFSLNSAPVTQNEIARPDGNCAVDEVFDPYYGKCRQLYCPPLTEAVFGSCDTRLDVQAVRLYELGVLFLPISRRVFNSSLLNATDKYHFTDTLQAIANSYLSRNFSNIYSFKIEMFVEMNTSLVIALSTHFVVITSHEEDITLYDWYKSLQRLFFEEVVININSLNNLECILKPFTQRGITNALHSYERIGGHSYQKLLFESGLVQEPSRPTRIVVKIENDKPFPYIIMNQMEYCELASTLNITSAIFVKDSCPLLNNTFVHTSSNSSQVLVQLDVFGKLVGKGKVVPYTTEYTAHGIVSFVTSCFSMTCVAFAFCLNFCVKRMLNTPTLIFEIALCNLFIAQGLFQFGSGWVDYKLLCQIVALGVHYFWLATVFSFNAFCSLIVWNLQRMNTPPLRSKELVISIIYVFGLPLILVLINIVYSANLPSPNDRYIGYGSTKCHIDSALMRYLLFAGPIFLTVISNCIIYALIVHKIKSISVPPSAVKNGVRYASVYFRLLLVTGIMWIFGFINEYVQSEVIEYIFIVLIGGQGVTILLFFTCNRVLYQKLCGVCCAYVTNRK